MKSENGAVELSQLSPVEVLQRDPVFNILSTSNSMKEATSKAKEKQAADRGNYSKINDMKVI